MPNALQLSPDIFVTVGRICEATSEQPQTIYRWIADGMPCARIGKGRSIRIRLADVNAYLAAKVTTTPRKAPRAPKRLNTVVSAG